MKSAIAAVLLVLPLGIVAAQEESTSEGRTREQFEQQFKYQSGQIVLKGGLATLDVPEGFRYLDPDQSETLLTEGWGNPSGNNTLGMLFPAGLSPMSDEGWGVVITFEEDGFVKDDEAASLDYDKLLRQMQEETAEDSKARQKKGYESIQLVGWAAPPRYDAATHKLYWAQDLRFGDGERHTLNYNIRVLGRRGVLVLNAVAGLDQLPRVEAGMRTVLGFVEFNEGHRYADFDPNSDKVASYGIAALIAGTVAAKSGLLKVLLTALLAAKKLVVVAVAGAAAAVRKAFGRKGAEPSAARAGWN